MHQELRHGLEICTICLGNNMRLHKIDYASSGLPPVQFDIKKATTLGDIDNEIVWHYTDGEYSVCFFKKNEQIAAYIAMTNKQENGYNCLVRVENISMPKGSITALIAFIISKMKLKLVILNSEKLTYDGLTWLCRLIQSNGRGLKLSDQFGKFPNAKALESEWHKAKDDYICGPTTVFIENKNIHDKPIFESRGLIKPLCSFIRDMDIE